MRWTLELWERDSLVRMAREQKVVENATVKHSMHVRDVETRSTRLQIVPTLIERAENVERSVIWQVRADQLDRNNPSQRVTASRARVAKVRVLPKRAGIAVTVDTCRHTATVSVAGSQETVMVGAIGSYFDLGSVSEWTLELRGENEGICSVGTASVCEGDVVDIEIDSGAEVSCIPSNIGADTYPLHETRLSMCGGHHVAAGGGKLHELGARILGLETDDVREATW